MSHIYIQCRSFIWRDYQCSICGAIQYAEFDGTIFVCDGCCVEKTCVACNRTEFTRYQGDRYLCARHINQCSRCYCDWFTTYMDSDFICPICYRHQTDEYLFIIQETEEVEDIAITYDWRLERRKRKSREKMRKKTRNQYKREYRKLPRCCICEKRAHQIKVGCGKTLCINCANNIHDMCNNRCPYCRAENFIYGHILVM